jgi:uncharacterized surface anchored protein
MVGSAYQQQPDQYAHDIQHGGVSVTFVNELKEEQFGEIRILKHDEAGEPLAGATFSIEPNPYDGASLSVTDNVSPEDTDPADGVIHLVDVPYGTYDIQETDAPPGYEKDTTVYTVTVDSVTPVVTVEFVNTPEEEGATRTPGFWMVHCDFTKHVFDVHLGGSIDLGWRVLDSYEDLFGMFWANNAWDSNGVMRSKLCKAKVIGSFHLTAAILNTGLGNGAPVPIDPVTGDDLITAMQNALSGDDSEEILRIKDLLDEYNNSGTEVEIVDDDGYPVLPADPHCAWVYAFDNTGITIAVCD